MPYRMIDGIPPSHSAWVYLVSFFLITVFAHPAHAQYVVENQTISVSDTLIARGEPIQLGPDLTINNGADVLVVAPTSMNLVGAFEISGGASFAYCPSCFVTDVSVEDEMLRSLSFSLEPNYPNPFSRSTEIAYELEESGEMSLVLYNALGQQVRTLFEGHQQQGVYRIVWDGADHGGQQLASGVYYYRLTVGQEVVTRKMTKMQ